MIKEIIRNTTTLVTVGLLVGRGAVANVEARSSNIDQGSSSGINQPCPADLEIDGHCAPFTRVEINSFYGLDPLKSDACKGGGSSQDCLDIYNRCNANSLKPIEERVTGCFDRYTPIYDAQTGAMIGVIEELTNFTSTSEVGQTLYTPVSK